MKKIKPVILFLLIFLQSVIIYSQEVAFIPPSPQSFSFVKATNIVSENEHTGSVNVNIPLFTYKSNKLSTDISLLYSGTGVKVDDLPNDAGMTWVVNAGGVITRTVNGLIDEKSTDRMNKTEAELVQKTASDCAADNEIITACYTPIQIDTERDLFDFRVADISGSFYLDENFIPVFLKNDSDVRIKNILPDNETNNRKFIGFEMTTKEGLKYIFGGSIQYWETTASKAMPANPPGDYAITSFFLKEIQYINGEKIFFNYEDTPLITNKISEIHTRYLYSCCLGTGIMPDVDPELRISTQTHYTKNKKRLQTVSNSENSDSLTFIYADKSDSDFKKYLSGIEYKVNNTLFKKVSFDYLFEDPNVVQVLQRFYLTQLNFYTNNIFEKKYRFIYNEPLELPKRLTYGQDIYGYYNGQIYNTSLIAGFFGNSVPPSFSYGPSILSSFGNRRPDFSYASKGTLKEVIYPTGGKTKFEYEAPKTKAVFKTKVVMGEDIFTSNGTETKILENLHFNQVIPFTITTYSGPGSSNHMKQAYFTVKDLDTDQQIYSGSKSYGYEPQDSINGSFNVQQNKRYLLTFTPNGVAEIKLSYSHKDPIDNFGIRLKSVTHSENGQVSEYKKFYYRPASLYASKEEDLVENEMMIIPSVQYATFEEFHEGVSVPVTYSAHSSTNSSPLYNSRLQERYRFVTASLGGDYFENGGYQNTYKKDSDDPLVRIQPASAGGGGVGSPSSGMGYFGTFDGLPNFFGIILNSLYFPAKGNRLSFSGMLQNTKYYVKRNGNVYKNKQIQNQYRYNILNTNSNLFVSQTFRDLTSAVCGTNNVQRISNFYISTYKNYTVDTKLEKSVITDYIDEVPLTLYSSYDDYLSADSLNTSESSYRKLITTTNYEYSGMPLHNQVTRQITLSPESSITERSYQYAYEKGNQLMIGKNIVGIPLETVTTQTIGGVTKTLDKTESLYPMNHAESVMKTEGLPLPYSVLKQDIESGSMILEVDYKYDNKGNVIEYTTKSGLPVTIVWGYNKALPIAKIEGAKYRSVVDNPDLIQAVLASEKDADPALYNLQPEVTENILINKLDQLRNNVNMVNYQITTYTYDPLIGVRSITPPSGIKESYIYDSANRLEKVIDVNGKVLKEFKYNYKN